jgi:hypothetical protein
MYTCIKVHDRKANKIENAKTSVHGTCTTHVQRRLVRRRDGKGQRQRRDERDGIYLVVRTSNHIKKKGEYELGGLQGMGSKGEWVHGDRNKRMKRVYAQCPRKPSRKSDSRGWKQ